MSNKKIFLKLLLIFFVMATLTSCSKNANGTVEEENTKEGVAVNQILMEETTIGFKTTVFPSTERTISETTFSMKREVDVLMKSINEGLDDVFGPDNHSFSFDEENVVIEIKIWKEGMAELIEAVKYGLVATSSEARDQMRKDLVVMWEDLKESFEESCAAVHRTAGAQGVENNTAYIKYVSARDKETVLLDIKNGETIYDILEE